MITKNYDKKSLRLWNQSNVSEIQGSFEEGVWRQWVMDTKWKSPFAFFMQIVIETTFLFWNNIFNVVFWDPGLVFGSMQTWTSLV